MVYGNTGSGASVDADDGVIDGSGANGASATAVTVFTNPDSSFWFDAIQFDFDSSELGYLPTAVGFVLTAGAGSMSGLTVYDGQGNFANFDTTSLLLDPFTTSDDRFIGITNPNGISSLIMGRTIIAASGDFASPRLDHLQYGLVIPEPNATALVCSALGVILALRRGNKGVRNRLAIRFLTPLFAPQYSRTRDHGLLAERKSAQVPAGGQKGVRSLFQSW